MPETRELKVSMHAFREFCVARGVVNSTTAHALPAAPEHQQAPQYELQHLEYEMSDAVLGSIVFDSATYLG